MINIKKILWPFCAQLILFVLFTLSHIFVVGQEVTTIPETPRFDEEITLFYDATKGNQELKDLVGNVYFHAGLITAQSRDERDWKFVAGNWGSDDPKFMMQRVEKNLYQIKIQPRSFFNVPQDVKVLQLALVFRNADGSKVGKTMLNTDIYVPLDGYTPPVNEKASYLFDQLNYKAHHAENGLLRIETDRGDVVFRPFTDSIIETSWHPNGFKGFEPSHAIIATPQAIEGQITTTNDRLIYDLQGIQILIHKRPFKITYLSNGKTILSDERGFFARTDGSGMRFRLDQDEKLYGSGFRASGINLRGRKLGLYNRPDYNYEIGADNLNYQVPLLQSSKKYLLFVDNPHKAWFDADSKGDGVLEFAASGGPMRYFIVSARSHTDLSKAFARLTGRQPMLPRWAFGNLQSRMAYRTQEETEDIVNQMIVEDFPIDAIILDFYWFGDNILGHLGRLDWWKPSWPEPEKMIADFRSKGVKTITISEPYIIDSLANWRIADSLGILVTDRSGNSYVDKQFYFGPGSLIDIFKPEAQQWLWQEYRKQFDIGIEGLWGDLGEPESHPSDIVHVWGMADEVHNIYGHYWSKMIFENFRNDFPDRRLFFLARSGFAGTQRYGIVPWSGDVSRSWGGLKAQLPAMLNMSISGLPYMHSDAGGFATGVKDEELYTRWLQFSALTPILRPHGSTVPSEPIFFNDTTKRIVRHFMKLRYELLPYIYTAAWKNSVSGIPIVRPLFYDYPQDERFDASYDSYFFGPDLLISPVVEPGLKRMHIELPQGVWYHFWTGTRINGGRRVQVNSTLESIPIFVRGGSVIPRVPAVNTTRDYSSRKLTLHTYLPGNDGTFGGQMFEDDGYTYDTYERGEFELLHFEGLQQLGTTSLRLHRSGDGWNGMPESRMVEVVLYGVNKRLRDIQFDERKLPLLQRNEQKGIKSGFWQNDDGDWHIRFVWHGNDATLTAR